MSKFKYRISWINYSPRESNAKTFEVRADTSETQQPTELPFTLQLFRVALSR